MLIMSVMLISACTSDNNDNKVTDAPQATLTESITETPAPTESEITETPIPTEPEITDIPVNTEGEEGMPIGKWYDKNGSTVIEFVGNKMYATWWSGMETPEEFNCAI